MSWAGRERLGQLPAIQSGCDAQPGARSDRSPVPSGGTDYTLEGKMSSSPGATVYWLFGRGASIECGLTWTVPTDWASLPRNVRIERINDQVRAEMDRAEISGRAYRRLLDLLSRGTQTGWRHLFVTTNWDYLLQREILGLGLTVLPAWLRNSHVSHMNGTVEQPRCRNSDHLKFSPFNYAL
jgi:hypothetical protein